MERKTDGRACMDKTSFLSNKERSAGRMSVAFSKYMYTAWYRKPSW